MVPNSLLHRVDGGQDFGEGIRGGEPSEVEHGTLFRLAGLGDDSSANLLEARWSLAGRIEQDRELGYDHGPISLLPTASKGQLLLGE